MFSLQKSLTTLSHITSLLLLALLSIRLWRNLRFLRWVRSQEGLHQAPLPCVSVLVPARNEATTITACITSLLNQEYANKEILVLDDASTDGTGELLDALSARYAQLHVIHAIEEPPSGWNGKSYACQRLAERATGEWLLFTDADTLHAPQSIACGMTQVNLLNATLLSAFPYQRTETWSERLAVSFILDFLPLVGLDFRAMWRGKSKRVAANGQYLLVHAASYRALGGHRGISSALVDDFALAQLVASAGYTTALVDGTQMLSCRMYSTFREVWNGFSKNLLEALSSVESKPPLWLAPLFAWGYASLFVLPFFSLVFGDHKRLAAIEICWLGLLRGMVTRYLRRAPDEIATTPLAAWGVMAIGMGALYRRWRQREIAWKDRLYPN